MGNNSFSNSSIAGLKHQTISSLEFYSINAFMDHNNFNLLSLFDSANIHPDHMIISQNIYFKIVIFFYVQKLFQSFFRFLEFKFLIPLLSVARAFFVALFILHSRNHDVIYLLNLTLARIRFSFLQAHDKHNHRRILAKHLFSLITQ